MSASSFSTIERKYSYKCSFTRYNHSVNGNQYVVEILNLLIASLDIEGSFSTRFSCKKCLKFTRNISLLFKC